MNQFVELIQFYESFMACLLVYDRFDLHVVLVSMKLTIFFIFSFLLLDSFSCCLLHSLLIHLP